MTELSKNTIGKFLGQTVLMLSLATAGLAKDVSVPFLFSEDEKLDQTELRKVIPRSTDLQNNAFFNAPLTRLEYMLATLESHLNRQLAMAVIREKLSLAFGSNRTESLSIRNFARYSGENGRIVVGISISGLGRPKKPMQIACDEVLHALEVDAPQENVGLLYHNTALGVLAHEDLSTYTPALETFAKNVVHRVVLESKTADLRVIHGLACQRIVKDGPIQYHRYSFDVTNSH